MMRGGRLSFGSFLQLWLAGEIDGVIFGEVEEAAFWCDDETLADVAGVNHDGQSDVTCTFPVAPLTCVFLPLSAAQTRSQQKAPSSTALP